LKSLLYGIVLFWIVPALAQELIKQDSFGRNYIQKDKGKIHFLLDANYSPSPISFSQVHVHEAEWQALWEARKFLPALQVLNSLKYCVETEPLETRKLWKLREALWTEKISRIHSKYSDVLFRERKWIDPEVCLKQEQQESFTYLRSLDFGISLKIPSSYRYTLPKKKDFVEDSYFRWTSQVFSEQMEPEFSENTEPDLDFFWKYSVGKNPIPVSRWRKLYILFLEHKLDKLTEKQVLDFWDRKRGLTPNNANLYDFKRIKGESEFSRLEQDGQTIPYKTKEKILTNGHKSVSLFFVFPVEESEKPEADWNFITKSLGP
jgi:hypothetical protein